MVRVEHFTNDIQLVFRSREIAFLELSDFYLFSMSIHKNTSPINCLEYNVWYLDALTIYMVNNRKTMLMK